MNQKRFASGCVAILALGGMALGVWLPGKDPAPPTAPVGYIVCGDEDFRNHRVFRIDLARGRVMDVSEPMEWMGNPQVLALDTINSRLYIGSYRGKAPDFWPITVVSVEKRQFEVIDRFSTHPDDKQPRQSYPRNPKPAEIYQLVLSPDADELYVSHGGLSGKKAWMAVWDPNTGKVLRELEEAITIPINDWSPDGRYTAWIWPPETYERNENGQSATRRKEGSVGPVKRAARNA